MRRERNPSVVRDISWNTQSCVLGYSTASPWSHIETDDEDVNIVCKSHYEDLLAVGNNHGSLKLFKYPASSPKVLTHSRLIPKPPPNISVAF